MKENEHDTTFETSSKSFLNLVRTLSSSLYAYMIGKKAKIYSVQITENELMTRSLALKL